MNTHFANVDDARHAVELAVRAWEVDTDLRWGLSGLRFNFDGADVIDRTPPPPCVVNAYAFVGGVGALTATDTLSVHVTRAAYPAPPPPTFPLQNTIISATTDWWHPHVAGELSFRAP